MDTKALRQKVLDLAIRGKLVPQDPNDEPASVLLERIRQQKQQMVKEGKLKAKDIKNDSIIFVGEDNLHYEKFADGSVKCIEDDIPFDLPDGWAWSRFGCVVTLMSGTTYPAENELLSGDRLYVKVGDMNLPGNEREIVTSSRYLDEYNPSHLVPINSVIFPKRGGAIATNKKKLVLQNEILIDLNTMAFTPVSPVSLMYCYYWFLSIDLGKINSGSSVPQINNKDIEPLLFPVPPVSEQEKIIQAIIPLLDAEQRINSAGAEISRLVSCAKSKILDLAIRGQLVPQDPTDEPASILLERIRAEKEELIKAGKIKHDKKESVIFRGEDNSYYEKIGSEIRCIDLEIPFEIPDGWTYERLGNICSVARGGSPRPIENYLTDDENGLNWIKIGDTEQGGKYIFSTKEKIRPNGLSKTRYVHCGDFLLTNSMSFGRPYILKTDGCIHDGWLVIGDVETMFYQDFLYYMLSSPAMFNALSSLAVGSTVKNLKSDSVKSLIVPIPPIEEQKLIATRIESLFTVAAQIEKSLN